GSPYSSFLFQVQDDGGTFNGGIDLDPTPNTMTFNVTPVNDPPHGTSGSVTTYVSTDYTFRVGDFGFADPNDSPPNALKNVIITSTNVFAGRLTLYGSTLGSGPVVVAAILISSGGLVYTAPDTVPASPDSFTFRV